MNCLSIHKLFNKETKFKYLHFNNARLKTEVKQLLVSYTDTHNQNF